MYSHDLISWKYPWKSVDDSRMTSSSEKCLRVETKQQLSHEYGWTQLPCLSLFWEHKWQIEGQQDSFWHSMKYDAWKWRETAEGKQQLWSSQVPDVTDKWERMRETNLTKNTRTQSITRIHNEGRCSSREDQNHFDRTDCSLADESESNRRDATQQAFQARNSKKWRRHLQKS